MAISVDSCVVALLGRDDGARHQLRQALEELGAAVAFEGEPASVSGANVLDVAPNVVIVNLEEGAEDDLDHLQALFDDPSINVVFNEAGVSRSLEGWDLARWARHLAAKVLGNDNTMPPPPEGAELLQPRDLMPTPGAVPTPAQLAPEQSMDTFRDEAVNVSDAVPADELSGMLSPAPTAQAGAEDIVAGNDATPAADAGLEIDFSMLEDALTLQDSPPPERLPPTPESVEEQNLAGIDVGTLDMVTSPADAASVEPDVGAGTARQDESPAAVEETFDYSFEDFDAEPAAESPGAASFETPQIDTAADEDTAGFSIDFSAMDSGQATDPASAGSAGADTPAPVAEGLEADFSWDINELSSEAGEELDATGDTQAAAGGGFDAAAWNVSSDESGFDENLALDDDVAALAAQLDALEASSTPAGEDVPAGLDFSHLEQDDVAASAPESSAPTEPETAPVRDSETLLAGAASLSLAPLEQQDADAGDAQPAPEKPSYDFGSLSGLSLEPLEGEGEEEAAPAAGAADSEIDPLLMAMGLVESPEEAPAVAEDASSTDEAAEDDSKMTVVPATAGGAIERVIVLGASIGGPDAVRTFLSEFPDQFPALFLLVQHLESGYFERLAQQLQKSSPLPVKVAAAGSIARHGEVLVVPASDRVSVDSNGQVTFEPHPAPPQYSPSIDAVLQSVADLFGNRATAIIFSGMAGDAVEGAVYLAGRGGEVWAQDPQTCVVSSMVDGARARGVVEFTGSPRDLAQRCITMFNH
ncbi:MAG: chemotaxis protein CheB [Lysobacteraceae bacterium]